MHGKYPAFRELMEQTRLCRMLHRFRVSEKRYRKISTIESPSSGSNCFAKDNISFFFYCTLCSALLMPSCLILMRNIAEFLKSLFSSSNISKQRIFLDWARTSCRESRILETKERSIPNSKSSSLKFNARRERWGVSRVNVANGNGSTRS